MKKMPRNEVKKTQENHTNTIITYYDSKSNERREQRKPNQFYEKSYNFIEKLFVKQTHDKRKIPK